MLLLLTLGSLPFVISFRLKAQVASLYLFLALQVVQAVLVLEVEDLVEGRVVEHRWEDQLLVGEVDPEVEHQQEALRRVEAKAADLLVELMQCC